MAVRDDAARHCWAQSSLDTFDMEPDCSAPAVSSLLEAAKRERTVVVVHRPTHTVSFRAQRLPHAEASFFILVARRDDWLQRAIRSLSSTSVTHRRIDLFEVSVDPPPVLIRDRGGCVQYEHFRQS